MSMDDSRLHIRSEIEYAGAKYSIDTSLQVFASDAPQTAIDQLASNAAALRVLTGFAPDPESRA